MLLWLSFSSLQKYPNLNSRVNSGIFFTILNKEKWRLELENRWHRDLLHRRLRQLFYYFLLESTKKAKCKIMTKRLPGVLAFSNQFSRKWEEDRFHGDVQKRILPILSPICDQLIDADRARRVDGVRKFFAFSCVHSRHKRPFGPAV